MRHRVVIVDNDNDWKAVYVDGELKTEGHSIRPQTWLCLAEKYQFKSNEIGTYTMNEEEIAKETFPDNLQDLNCTETDTWVGDWAREGI